MTNVFHQIAYESIDEELAAIKMAERRHARSSLSGLACYCHEEVFGDPYDLSWFHQLICDAIEDWMFAVDPYNLVLMMPPRHGKSQLASRYLPPYIFGRIPHASIIASSYTANLAEAMSRDTKRIMASESYRRLFPLVRQASCKTEGDGMVKQGADEWYVAGGKSLGHYRGTGVGGSLTGYGADFGIIDDPFKGRKEAESKIFRDTCWEWYRSVFRTRLEKGGRMLILLTRWHEDDLVGRILKQTQEEPNADKWIVLSFPALYEKTDFSHPGDTRKTGEPLWPEKYDMDALLKLKATVGEYDWSSLFQQRPTPPGGAIIQREWLTNIILPGELPEGLRWVRFWDLAVSVKKKADHTAGVQVAVDRFENVYLRSMIHGQWTWPKVREIITSVARYEGVPVGIESVGTQQGFTQDLQASKDLRGVAVMGYNVTADKLTRALPWIAKAQVGKLFLVQGPWIGDFVEEAVTWTGNPGDKDDQIDAVSGGYVMACGSGSGLVGLGKVY